MSRFWKIMVGLVVLIIVGSVSVPIVLIARFGARGRDVQVEIAAIRAEGAPVSASELQKKSVPDSENGALVYEKALAGLWKSDALPMGKTVSDFLDPGRRAADPELSVSIRSILAQHTETLTLAEEAVSMRKCRYPVAWRKTINATFPHLSPLRMLARLLAAQALVDAQDGDMDKAAHDIEMAYCAANSLAEEPNLVSQLVRYSSVRVISSALVECASVRRLDEASARELASKTEIVDLSESVRRAWLGERATGITIFSDFRKGRIASGDMVDTVRQFYGSMPGGMWLNNDEYYFLQEMRQLLEDSALPYRTVRAKYGDMDREPPRYAILSAIILPVSSRVNAARDRAIASLDGAQVFLGLVAYRGRFGSYPRALEDLRKLHWRTPEDPFSGKPFVYHRKGRGFILYSVGEDLRDNGGVERPPLHPAGARPSQRISLLVKPADIIWKLDH